MKHFLLKIFGLVLLCACLLAARTVFAATISAVPNISSVAPGKNFVVDIRLNTNGELINTVSGSVLVPTDSFSVSEIREGNSQINFWVEEPHTSATNAGEIDFAGITPGGLSGGNVLLFSLVLSAKKPGSPQITFGNFAALKNDGKGTAADTKTTSALVSVLPGSNAVPLGVDLKDTDPPETFVPVVASDPALFDGKYFIVFAAQDKGSGIDHYEVKEGIFGTYKNATSPHLLSDQSLKSQISVKAIDKKGNVRVATLPAKNGIPLYLLVIFLVILLIVCTFAFIMLRARFRR